MICYLTIERSEWAAILPDLGRACDCLAAQSWEMPPSDGRPRSCLPSASFCSASRERKEQITPAVPSNLCKLFLLKFGFRIYFLMVFICTVLLS